MHRAGKIGEAIMPRESMDSPLIEVYVLFSQSMGPSGSFKKSGALIQIQNGRALFMRTLTKGLPLYRNTYKLDPLLGLRRG